MAQTTTKQQERGAETPRIYVADLADYNAGILRGRWIEIGEHTDVDEIRAEIHEMLAETGHEEYAIHDYNDIPYGDLGEYPPLEKVVAVAHAVKAHGYRLVKGYLNHFDIENLEELEDRFRGIYESVEDYARELIDECYDLEKMMGNLAYYFDYEAYTRDLEMDLVVVELTYNEVAIFSY
jgi:antirestriction protein